MLWRASTYLEWYWRTISYVTDSRKNPSFGQDKYIIKILSWQVCRIKFQQKIKKSNTQSNTTGVCLSISTAQVYFLHHFLNLDNHI